jgi:phage baseplate assembly protein gpV
MMPTNQNDDVLARLIELVEGRFFGKYRGRVTNNSDPNNLGRIKAKVPRVLGDEESGWALPAFIYGGAGEQGFFAVPDEGAGVWIEFEGGDLSYPVWCGTWYTGGAIPESAQAGKKVLKTKSGHKIVFDDDHGTVEITDSNDNTINMAASTIKIAAGSATTIIIDAPQIQLVDGASSPLVLGDQLLQYLNQIVQIYQTHVHAGQAAPPALPMPPPTPSLLSVKVTTG